MDLSGKWMKAGDRGGLPGTVKVPVPQKTLFSDFGCVNCIVKTNYFNGFR